MSQAVVRFMAFWVALAVCSVGPRCQAAEWKKFTSQAGDFVVLMPSTPQEKLGTVNTKNDEHEFFVEGGDSAYLVIYIDFDATTAWLSPERTLDTFVQGGIKSKKKNTVLGERPITLNGYPGRVVTYKPTDGYLTRSKIVLVKQRLYQVMVVGIDKIVNSKEADNFLNSFGLIGKYDPPVTPIVWQQFAPAAGCFTVLMPGAVKQMQDPQLQMETKFGRITIHGFMAVVSGVDFAVAYGDYAAGADPAALPKQFLDAYRDWVIKKLKAKLVSEKDVSLGTVMGRETTLELPIGAISHSRMYLVGRRLFRTEAMTPVTKRNDAGVQADINKFLESFQLVPAP